MEGFPTWMWPLITVVGATFGGWIGVKVALTRREVNMETVLQRLNRHERRLGMHNDDLLVHDIELEQVLHKMDLPRAKRQPLRDWEV